MRPSAGVCAATTLTTDDWPMFSADTHGGNPRQLGCREDGPGQKPRTNKTLYPLHDTGDEWLCFGCSPSKPCRWHVGSDPREVDEVAAQNPQVVAKLLGRLRELQKDFRNATTVPDSGPGVFCGNASARAIPGLGPFVGPWIADNAPTKDG